MIQLTYYQFWFFDLFNRFDSPLCPSTKSSCEGSTRMKENIVEKKNSPKKQNEK